MSLSNNLESRLSNKICPDGMSVEEWQIALRRANAQEANFTVEHLDENRIWGDYLVSSGSGRYRTAFRGVCSDRNFCSCLDFRTNGLGTCKHLEAVSLYLEKNVDGYPWAGMTYTPTYSSIYVSYKGGRSIRMRIGSERTDEYLKLYKRYFDEEGVLPFKHYPLLRQIAEEGLAISSSFRVYEDVYDFSYEQIGVDTWRRELEETYPSRRIPWNRVTTSEAHKPLEELLFDLCYGGFGLIITKRHTLYSHIISRLCEEIYQGVHESKPGYIIVEKDEHLDLWKQNTRLYSELQALPIRIMTSAQFVAHVGNSHISATFVYIDQANVLKTWQNSLSLAIKKMSIEHLYMRIDTLYGVTPVQLSSILQHINPFVLGPFYKFIHQYRPIFPLKDDGSNMPSDIAPLIHLCSDLSTRISDYVLDSLPVMGLEVNNIPINTASISPNSQARVRDLIEALINVSQDPEALQLLRNYLGK